MAVLLFKLFTLLCRTMARPIIAWVTYYNRVRLQSSNGRFHVYVKIKLEKLGQTVNYYNILINRKLFKLSTKEPIKPLSEEKALEKGAESIGELFVYAILISLPIWEIMKLTKSSNEKERIKENRLRELRNDLNQLVIDNETISNDLEEIKDSVLKIKTQLSIKNTTYKL